ncbi:Single-stranded DNA-binding protein [Corynebacterium humireducens NBRC 106098 = DSM 45392]|uniref:Single-stranded DNA-binding protein n=1 Tax=Corynebacterium humireducens NBRC 106098 = DSM 45392 TaxID=1223515 RepID=A0A0B5D4L6_9CORY|nr:single-stranded DNA-binding protein [Corynebacterium humireducens]AJE33925.1 Single-stranded DNA-binding protein [Corynebacterium humireducens NBRC 106098 = DSM 45392]
MAQTTSTIIGNLTEEPVLHHFEKTGNYKARVRVASSRRVRDKERPDTWNDVDPLYIYLEMWGPLALNAKKSLSRGMPVIAHGTFVTAEWDDREGKKQQMVLLRCYSLGLDLNRYVIASQRIETAEKNLIGAALPADVDPQSLCDKVHRDNGEPDVGTVATATSESGEGDTAPPF